MDFTRPLIKHDDGGPGGGNLARLNEQVGFLTAAADPVAHIKRIGAELAAIRAALSLSTPSYAEDTGGHTERGDEQGRAKQVHSQLLDIGESFNDAA